jgi:aldose 1-epimerase
MAAARETFGTLPDGRTVEAVVLSNGRGLEARIIAWGAALQALLVPGRDGEPADVTLGYATLEDYLAGTEYFGCTVGRVANRIARGRFALDGKEYVVPVNDGVNSLHGGTAGFDKVLWEVTEVGEHEVSLRYVSPDGDQGYPGTLTASATYSVEPDANVLRVAYAATTDAPTVVNLSSHAYWNLAGEGAARGVMDHLLTIPADHFTPIDAGAIPTGEIRAVDGTPFDFRRPTPIGARVRDASDEQIRFGKGYDHNWVVARDLAAAPRLLARLEDPVSGRVLEVHSNQPGLQFYSGNFLDASRIGKAGRLYRMGDGIALEPQKFPDTPNRPEFGTVRLDPGRTYDNLIEFRFSARP